jgi:cytidylate kinase
MIVVIVSDITYNIEPFAKKLAVSLGAVYRQLDDDFLLKNTGFFEEPKQGKMVFIGHVLATKLKVPSIKIFLKESDESINNRISLEQKLSVEEAKIYHADKIKSERERLLKLYGIDLQSQDVYDLIMRIDNLDQKAVMFIIEKFIAKHSEDKK